MQPIKYNQQAPSPNPAHFIESLSYFENTKELPYHYTILPDGLCEIVLCFDEKDKLF
jgi:hypothetical protein